MRVLLSKPGLDGHDVGVKVLAHGLKEAGIEVHYTGLRKSIEEIVNMAVKINADIIGLSILSGTHLVLAKKMKEELQKRNLNFHWVVGGNIPAKDIDELKKIGANEAFATGTKVSEVVLYFISIEKNKN
ncbi:MAG: cobalamin B12-binding domain-containing protein [Bacteroidia bacterium]|nr:cobalamin B12-binding domain-containing protein [Bacteroidia bacterium]